MRFGLNAVDSSQAGSCGSLRSVATSSLALPLATAASSAAIFAVSAAGGTTIRRRFAGEPLPLSAGNGALASADDRLGLGGASPAAAIALLGEGASLELRISSSLRKGVLACLGRGGVCVLHVWPGNVRGPSRASGNGQGREGRPAAPRAQIDWTPSPFTRLDGMWMCPKAAVVAALCGRRHQRYAEASGAPSKRVLPGRCGDPWACCFAGHTLVQAFGGCCWNANCGMQVLVTFYLSIFTVLFMGQVGRELRYCNSRGSTSCV